MTACTPSVSATDFPATIATRVEQTVNSAATKILSASVLPTNTIAAEESATASAQSDVQCTDAATFVTDVTILDGTVVVPGQTFRKTWRLKNSGTCTWTTFYTVELEKIPSNVFWADTLYSLTTGVEPGQSVDVSVNLTAPAIPGDYTASYQLSHATDTPLLFFTAVIKVQSQSSAGFEVTNVAYSVSTWSDTMNGRLYTNCPLITAMITTNGSGTVGYHWVALDESSPDFSVQFAKSDILIFDSAGTKAISQRVMHRESSGGQGMMYLGDSGGIYIDTPNPQSFGGIFLPVCGSP